MNNLLVYFLGMITPPVVLIIAYLIEKLWIKITKRELSPIERRLK